MNESFELNRYRHENLLIQAQHALELLEATDPVLTKHQHLLLDSVKHYIKSCFEN